MREARHIVVDGGAEVLDEVVADDVKHFHLESLNMGHWWIGLEHEDGTTTHINLFARRPSTTIVQGRCEFDM